MQKPKRKGKYKTLHLEGQQISNLKVIKRTNPEERGHSKWLCKCICGKEKIIGSRYLLDKRNKNKACGCIKNPNKEKHPSWKGFGEISGAYWYKLSYGAKIRKKEFTITIENAWNLFLCQNRRCKLSGVELTFTHSYIKDFKNQTASLDRIDSSKGYTEDNVQWIHKDIQTMKMDQSDEKFIYWSKLVAKNNPDIS